MVVRKSIFKNLPKVEHVSYPLIVRFGKEVYRITEKEKK